MIQEYQLRVLPEIAANEQRLKEYLSEEKGLNLRNINATRILKRSIDARQRTIFVNLKIRAYINEMPEEDEYEHTVYNSVEGKPQVIVVGAGPGGLFAALRLIELGLRPVIVERGKDVRERKKDLAQISREHTVNPESNYSFGEGGAGAYSDGKLYTRSKKRGNVDKIFNVFCQHGASTAILMCISQYSRRSSMLTRYSMYSASMELLRLYWLMHIRISERTSCRVSLKICGIRFSNVAEKYISGQEWMR